MSILKRWIVPMSATMLLVAAGVALPAESSLEITGTTYTKWLYGNQRTDGSLYNFTTVPGRGTATKGRAPRWSS